MRGTEHLAPEQRPSGTSRKMHGRTQPYRRKQRRSEALGMTLEAMLRGSPYYLPNPADVARARQKRARRRR